jgi:hypothetical protein
MHSSLRILVHAKNRLKSADELTGPRAGACQRGLFVLENFDNEKGQWIVLALVRRRLPAAKGLCSARSRSSARSRCACTSTLASRSIERERERNSVKFADGWRGYGCETRRLMQASRGRAHSDLFHCFCLEETLLRPQARNRTLLNLYLYLTKSVLYL